MGAWQMVGPPMPGQQQNGQQQQQQNSLAMRPPVSTWPGQQPGQQSMGMPQQQQGMGNAPARDAEPAADGPEHGHLGDVDGAEYRQLLHRRDQRQLEFRARRP